MRELQLATVAEVADRLSVSAGLVRKLISTKQLNAYRLGRLIKIDMREVDAWLESVSTTPPEAKDET